MFGLFKNFFRFVLAERFPKPYHIKLQALSFRRDVEPGITEMWYIEHEPWSILEYKRVVRIKNLSSKIPGYAALAEGEMVTVWYTEGPNTKDWEIHQVKPAVDDRDPSERG